MTPNTITNPDDFFQEIREIRRCGYAVNRGELRVDVSGVAVGVCDARGHTLAAIGISGPSEAFSAVRISEYARRVSEAGTALSERFGGGKHAVLVRSMSAWARQ